MTGFPRDVRTEPRIEIYQFTVYDVTSDKSITSKRWGTLSAIDSVRGQALRDSKRLVDASATRSDIPGLTVIGYSPPAEQ